MAIATGCVRLGMEFDRGTPHHAYHHPRLASDHFYAGTRGIAKHINIQPGLFMVLDICITSFSLVDMPFEIVADTLLLPVDIWKYSKYLTCPMLGDLVKNHRIDELRSWLEKGAFPDAYAVDRALELHDDQAFALLAEYGADIPETVYNTINLQNKNIIKSALLHDKNVSEKYAESYILLKWLELLDTQFDMTPARENDFLEIIDMLARHGFGINFYRDLVNYLRQTPLDIALGNKVLSEKSRTQLISVLKSNGAMTYRELALKKNLPHLRTEGLEIHPMFSPLLDLLESLPKAEMIRLSTHYQGIDAPVLVADYPKERKTVKMHRRKTDGVWDQDTEDFEIPTGVRFIFTPPDVHVPTRLQPDMPLYLLQERRFSFRDYELLMEEPGGIARELNWPLGWDSPEYSRGIRQLPSNPDGKYAHDGIFGKRGSHIIMAFFLESTEYTKALTYKNKKWLEKANRLTAAAGLAGHWRPVQRTQYGKTSFAGFVFTNHERFPEKMLPGNVPAPYPDEIICMLFPDDYEPSADTIISYDGKEGRTYWNYCNTMHVNILFGDEVSTETLDLLKSTIMDIMGK